MKKIIVLLLLMLFSFGQAIANDELGIVTGSKQGTYIKIGYDLQKLGDRFNYKINVFPSKGSLENIYSVFKTPGVQMGIVQSDVLAFIDFQKDTSAELYKISKKIKMIYPLYNEEIHVVGGKHLSTFGDLDGKTVAVGKKGSGTSLTATLLFKLSGVKPYKTVNIGGSEALTQLENGEIDAMFYVAGFPVSLLQNTNLQNSHLLTITNESILKVYPKSTIPANTYPWQKNNIDTATVKAALVTYDYKKANCSKVGIFANIIKNEYEWLKANGHPKWKSADISFNMPGWDKYSCIAKFANYMNKKTKKAPKQKSDNDLFKALEQMQQ